VYDGGGILPDVELETAEFSPIITALLKDHAIFDFATQYYYENQLQDWKGFEFSEADFQRFLAFLKRNNFEYETETEAEFADALKKAENDDLKEDISASYDALMVSIDKAKDKLLLEKKVQIKSLLTDEILKRYFYREGMYQYQTKHNPEILEALAVLNNPSKYISILK
jgi:carboxyl-terminal processing protease